MTKLTDILKMPLHPVELEQFGFVDTMKVYADLKVFKKDDEPYLFNTVLKGGTEFYQMHPASYKNLELLD